MPLLSCHVVGAHPLPTRAKVAVEQRKTGIGRHGTAQGSLEVPSKEARIAVNLAFSFGWQNEVVNKGGQPVLALAGIPECEAEILLPIVTQ